MDPGQHAVEVTPSTCFVDPVWLQYHGGCRPDNALEYFARSPFFERGDGVEFAVVERADPRGERADAYLMYSNRAGCLLELKRLRQALRDAFLVDSHPSPPIASERRRRLHPCLRVLIVLRAGHTPQHRQCAGDRAGKAWVRQQREPEPCKAYQRDADVGGEPKRCHARADHQ